MAVNQSPRQVNPDTLPAAWPSPAEDGFMCPATGRGIPWQANDYSDLVMPPLAMKEGPVDLGEGMAAHVYLCEDALGVKHVAKVFTGSSLARLVHALVSGIPDNPYTWCLDAVVCAHLRRNILATLVPSMFDERVTVAKSNGIRWNGQANAFELDTEYVNGRPALVHNTLDPDRRKEYEDLVMKILPGLQEFFVEIGFSPWQVGVRRRWNWLHPANPKAPPNCLRRLDTADVKWCLIDTESGLPAPYIADAIRAGAVSFDPVNSRKLEKYVNDNEAALKEKIPEAEYRTLLSNMSMLKQADAEWRATRGVERSLRHYHLRVKPLEEKDYRHYRRYPALWYGRRSRELTFKCIGKTGSLFVQSLEQLARRTIKGAELSLHAAEVLFSIKHREAWIANYLEERISAWEGRKQISKGEADSLRAEIPATRKSRLLDFAAHAALWPVSTAITSAVVPAMGTYGLIGPAEILMLGVLTGPVLRTIYTLGSFAFGSDTPGVEPGMRWGQRALKKVKSFPWIAFTLGMVPTLGNGAFIVEHMFAHRESRAKLPSFVAHDFVTRIAQHIPFVGGRDSYFEHRFAHAAVKLFGRREKKAGKAGGGARETG